SATSDQSRVLQEELTCPVCLDLYRDPYLLPCGHNFCKTCLDRLKRQAERGRFRCPECRDSHRCGASFQKNFKLANIADDYRHRRRATTSSATALKSRELLLSSVAVQQARSASSVPCDYCPSAAAEASGAISMFAVKTCLKCEVSMCQEHVRPHLELPAFREHPLTEPMNDLWKRKCPDHDEIYRYYCMDDKVCVCNACTIEGGHLGHTIKTLKNTMKDLKGTLDKQLYRVERKYSMAERKLQEQKEKERQNKKFMDDSDQGLARLGDELKAKVLRFVGRLRECTRTHCDTNGPAIQKNISRICQDQARLQEVRCGIESLMQENDPFHFIQVRQVEPFPQKEEEEEQEEQEEEAAEEEEDDDDDDLDDSSVEEMRSEGEEEDEEEEDDEDDGQDRSGQEEEEEEEGEDEDDEDEEEGEDEEERGV
uniref:E3 ubiquitin/ISG15 ligase TRIM25-like n=1 Tax=Labrus bergylta TaxID=56723 RepID=A0A3Q3E5R6_9LABR